MVLPDNLLWLLGAREIVVGLEKMSISINLFLVQLLVTLARQF
jgi:hypothetical protein